MGYQLLGLDLIYINNFISENLSTLLLISLFINIYYNMSFLNILQLLQVILAIYVLLLVFKKGALNSQFHVALVCLVVSILVIPPFGRNFINGATMESKEGYSTLHEAYGHHDARKEEHHKDHHARKDHHHKHHHARKDHHHKHHHARKEEHHKHHHARKEEHHDKHHRHVGKEHHEEHHRHVGKEHHEERIIRRETGHDHHHHDKRRHHEEHDKTSKDHVQPIAPIPKHKHNPSAYTPTHPATGSATKPATKSATGSAVQSAAKSAVQSAENVMQRPSSPDNIQMWMNNSVVYIIGKGTLGATLELSLSESPFTNILPSDVIVNSSGDIEYSINDNTDTTLFNNIVTELNGQKVYFRLSKSGQTSPIISWSSLNFADCYFNNPGQTNATGIKSFQPSLKAANEYCVNTLGWSVTNNGLPTSWP